MLWKMSGLVGWIFFFTCTSLFFSSELWKSQRKIWFLLHKSGICDACPFLPTDGTTKMENGLCSARQMGMDIWRVVVEEAFMSSEHRPRHHVACRWIKGVVCYRDVPSAVSYLLVRVGKDSEVTFLSWVFPSKFAVFVCSYKSWENNYLFFFFKNYFCLFR